MRSKRTRVRRPSAGSKRLPEAITKGHERFLRIALSMPGAEVSTSYGTPAIKVRGKLMARWRSDAEGALAVRCDFLDRQILLLAEPDVFFLTDHYRNYPMVLMRLEKASKAVMAEAVERAWRLVAPASLRRQRGGATPMPHVSH